MTTLEDMIRRNHELLRKAAALRQAAQQCKARAVAARLECQHRRQMAVVMREETLARFRLAGRT